MPAPGSLTLGRHRDLGGRRDEVWTRRAIVVLLAGLAVAALGNAFGQRPTTSRARGTAASLDVYAPPRLRAALLFQVRIRVHATRNVREPELVLDPGWFESMSVNAIEPQPAEQSSENGKVVLGYGPIEAGHTLTTWLYFQVNPTNIGHRSEDVVLRDGSQPIATVHRTITIFP